jgi:hypothetical protein
MLIDDLHTQEFHAPFADHLFGNSIIAGSLSAFEPVYGCQTINPFFDMQSQFDESDSGTGRIDFDFLQSLTVLSDVKRERPFFAADFDGFVHDRVTEIDRELPVDFITDHVRRDIVRRDEDFDRHAANFGPFGQGTYFSGLMEIRFSTSHPLLEFGQVEQHCLFLGLVKIAGFDRIWVPAIQNNDAPQFSDNTDRNSTQGPWTRLPFDYSGLNPILRHETMFRVFGNVRR